MRSASFTSGLIALIALAAGPAIAAECINNTNPANCSGSLTAKICGVDDPVCTAITDPNMPPQCCASGVPGGTGGQTCIPGGCNNVNNCRLPDVPNQPTMQVIDNGNGTFNARLKFDVTARWNDWAASNNPAGILTFEWKAGSTISSCGSSITLCQYAQSDRAGCWLEQSGLTCGGAPYDYGPVSVRVSTCSGSFGGCFCETFGPSFCPCWKKVDRTGLDFKVSKAQLGCAVPLPYTCGEGGGGAGGAAGASCPNCQPAGGGCSVSNEGHLSCAPPWAGNAQLRYAASGVGTTGLPGATAWRTILGLSWSHDYAERIVVDPDTTSPGHVWLLTKHGSFREFSNLASGSGLRLYQNRAPSDEFRKLYYDTSTGGWQLESLDGRTDHYRSDGQWEKTVTAQDPSNAVEGHYNTSGQLESVTFPDGHGDSFTYESGGKLSTITTEPVPGTSTSPRTWTLTWDDDELTEVERPDGSIWQFTYDSARPGYLTRVTLVSGSDSRVEAAFSYLSGTNRIEHSWRGDTSFSGSNAVDKTTFAYTNVLYPTEAVVTRSVSATFDQETTYKWERDTVSTKPRLTSIEGSCPTCGLSPTTTFAYTGSNPLLPSSMTDARGTRTDYTYDSNGRQLTKTEAANVSALTRVTTLTYHTNFPGLPTRLEVPSTSGGSNKRRTDFSYNSTTGVLESRVIDGYEGGSALPTGYKTTSFTSNSSGEVTAIDPPGYSTSDQTTFTYALTGRNGHVADSRTDPLSGTTTFDYDGFNRRTSVTDANGVETITTYDTLDRVTEVRRIGNPSPGGDLVTTNTYNALGDLFCSKLPRGNGVQYDYDAAGRLTTVTRGIVVATPSATSCIDTAEPRERIVYGLDGVGNRIDESREEWTGSAWASAFHTTHSYTCHVDKTTQGAGSSSPSVTDYCYDLNGNLEKVWDANHPQSTFTNPTQLYVYDALNRMTSTTIGPSTSAAATTTYAYDVQDHLSSLTDAEGNQTTYTTSDRDLLTQEVSPAAGTMTYTYDEHSQLLTKTDGRGILAERALDAAGRVEEEVFDAGGSDPVTTTYTYGSTPSQFDVGRLIDVTGASAGVTITLAYDRFGKLIQDGELFYEYDDNGYRTEILYPSGLTAIYTPDFADRDGELSYDDGSGPQALVTASSYMPFGPLTSLTLGNSLVETRDFDSRYFQDQIQVGTLLDWDYTTDGIGNPTEIDGTLDAVSDTASFSYQDNLYFLTEADGPWGDDDWTYDKIGNRMTSSGTNLPSWSYSYSGSGHGPRLEEVTEAATSTEWDFDHDAAGNQVLVTKLVSSVSQWATSYNIGADGRVASFGQSTFAASKRTSLLYDGRGFLASAQRQLSPGESSLPIYGSRGELFQLTHIGTSPFQPITDHTFFHFDGRPVAKVSSSDGLAFITTDHLGTPVLVTDGGGSVLSTDWTEPFRPRTDVLLQYPGQWLDTPLRIFHGGTADPDGIDQVNYNLNRWYEPATGRYTQADPLLRDFAGRDYAYSEDRPTTLADPTGLLPCNPGEIAQCRSGCQAQRRLFANCTAFEVPIPCIWVISYRFTKCDCGGCQPCPSGPPQPPEIHLIPNQHNCKYGHWHYYEWNQAPSCICFPKRRFGGCIDP